MTRDKLLGKLASLQEKQAEINQEVEDALAELVEFEMDPSTGLAVSQIMTPSGMDVPRGGKIVVESFDEATGQEDGSIKVTGATLSYTEE